MTLLRMKSQRAGSDYYTNEQSYFFVNLLVEIDCLINLFSVLGILFVVIS